MAHANNYNKSGLRDILREHDRTARTYKNFVDFNRTKLNWTYGGNNKTVDELIFDINVRCNDITQGSKLQDNTNIISEWVVTYPFTHCIEKTCDTGKKDKKGRSIMRNYNSPTDMNHCKKFFDEVYAFACDRYGAKNVIAGFVHMDETTPQIHIAFVPEATSRKTGRRTVSSASLMTKRELKDFHQDLEKHMQKIFGEKKMILNGRTKGNYPTDELKQRKADEEELERRKAELDARESALDAQEDDLKQKMENFTFEQENALQELSQREKSIEELEALEAKLLAMRETLIREGQKNKVPEVDKEISKLRAYMNTHRQTTIANHSINRRDGGSQLSL